MKMEASREDFSEKSGHQSSEHVSARSTPHLSSMHTAQSSCSEQFDSYGNVVKVGDLVFTDENLGAGAYASVVLAKRVANSVDRHSLPPAFHGGSFQEKIHIPIQEQTSQSMLTTTNTSDENYVAVKIYSKSLLKRVRMFKRSKAKGVQVRTALENVEREIALMKMMRHPNLVSLLQVIDSVESNALYLVLEFVPLGEIMSFDPESKRYRHRHKTTPGLTKGGYFNEETAALFFVDVLHGLAYLHLNCIAHRDLKPENILLSREGVAKISDFGVSHFFEEERSRLSARSLMNSFTKDDFHISTTDFSEAGTPKLTRHDADSALCMNLSKDESSGVLKTTEGTYPFFSPEMCNGTRKFSGYASDLWAAGVCLYIFTSGKLPFYSDAPSDLLQIISVAKIPFKGLKYSKTLKDLLSRLMQKDPSQRAGIGDCLQHRFCKRGREQRIGTIGEAIRRSSQTELVVDEEDERTAFSTARQTKTQSSTRKFLRQKVSSRILGATMSSSGSSLLNRSSGKFASVNFITDTKKEGRVKEDFLPDVSSEHDHKPSNMSSHRNCCSIQ